MELMEGGSLANFILRKKTNFEPITEMTAKRIVRQIVNGLYHLHQNRIIHRDIKPDNILIDDIVQPSKAKITDFGVSAKLNILLEDGLVVRCGTHVFKSPEQLKNEVYSKVDFVFRRQPIFGVLAWLHLCFFSKGNTRF